MTFFQEEESESSFSFNEVNTSDDDSEGKLYSAVINTFKDYILGTLLLQNFVRKLIKLIL